MNTEQLDSDCDGTKVEGFLCIDLRVCKCINVFDAAEFVYTYATGQGCPNISKFTACFETVIHSLILFEVVSQCKD